MNTHEAAAALGCTGGLVLPGHFGLASSQTTGVWLSWMLHEPRELPDAELLCPLRINVAEVSGRPASALRLFLLEKRNNP